MLAIPLNLPGSGRLLRFCAYTVVALTVAACATAPDTGAPDAAGKSGIPTQAARKGKAARADKAQPAASAASASADSQGSWNLFGWGTGEDGSGLGKQGSLEGLRADLGTFEQRGMASWYGKGFHGRKTANGERFDMRGMTAAHPTLPLDSWVLVRNLRNNKVAVLRINDRGPYHGNRVLDVSYGAARRLGFVDHGATQVEIRRLSRTEVAALGPQEGAGTDAGDGTGADDMAIPAAADTEAAAAQPRKTTRHVRRKRH